MTTRPSQPQPLTVPGLFPPPDYAHAWVVPAGRPLVFTAGAVPLDAGGDLVGYGNYQDQTVQALTNLERILDAAGSSLEQVVTSTIHVVAKEPEQLHLVWDIVRRTPLAAAPHAATLVGVSVLGYAGQVVEITAVATR